MEKRINVAKLLKDCPEGMELDCTIWDNVTLVHVDNEDIPFPITLSRTKDGSESYFVTTKYGQYYSDSKCVIFPKGKTTWEGFHRPFKDGDVVAFDTEKGVQLFIFKEYIYNYDSVQCYMMLDCDGKIDFEGSDYYVERLATEEEKEKLFKAIKDNGCKWNPETKTLEKLVEPKFKDGDRIKSKGINLGIVTITRVCEDHYELDDGCTLKLNGQDYYELVLNKFDITTLVPFESKVLVRDMVGDMGEDATWYPAIWGCTGIPNIDTYPYIVLGGVGFEQCIPYEGNEHLLGTNNDCDAYYKTWE